MGNGGQQPEFPQRDPPDDGIDRLHAHSLLKPYSYIRWIKNDTQQIPTMLPSRLSSNKDSTRRFK